jgi:hypothetical protein
MNWPIPTCPECKCEFSLVLTYSDIYGACIQCQNCNDEFPMSDLKKLFKGKE